MKNPIRQSYYFLTTVTETNLISLLAGMISGIAMGTVTSKSVTPKELSASIYFFLSVAGFIALNTVRQHIDKEYAAWSDAKMAKKEKWRAAADYNNTGRVIVFFLSFIISVGGTAIGICKIRQSNEEQGSIDAIKEKEQANKNKADSVRLQTFIQHTDSLLQVIKEKPFQESPAGKKKKSGKFFSPHAINSFFQVNVKIVIIFTYQFKAIGKLWLLIVQLNNDIYEKLFKEDRRN